MNLPKKIYKNNLFKKLEKGCVLYSFEGHNVIRCDLPDFEIEKDFAIDDKGVNMIKKINPNTITIGDTMVLKQNKNKFTIRLIKADLPVLNIENCSNKIIVNIDKLKIAKNFVSHEKLKPVLSGVNITQNGSIIATDGFIVFSYNMAENTGTTLPVEFINNIIDEFETGEVTISFDSTKCIAQKDNTTIISSLLDGVYPNLKKVFEKSIYTRDIVYKYDEFMSKINLSKYVESDLLTFENDSLKVSGENTFETSFDEIERFGDFKFNLSLKKIAILLNSFKKEDNITLKYIDEVSPIYISNDGNEFIILPIRS